MFYSTDFSFFFEDDDDDAPDDLSFDRRVTTNFHSTSMINPCLTITEENEEELEQIRRDDHEEELKKQNHFSKINDGSIPTMTLHDNDDRADLLENDQEKKTIFIDRPLEDYDERLSTIYEAPSPQLRIDDEDIYDDTYDKLIVYDIANVKPIEKVREIEKNSMMNNRDCFSLRILNRNFFFQHIIHLNSIELVFVHVLPLHPFPVVLHLLQFLLH